MKHRISMFTPKGDSVVAEWEDTDVAAKEEARGAFNQALAEGWGAVAVTPEGTQPVDRFPEEMEEVYLLRPIAGG